MDKTFAVSVDMVVSKTFFVEAKDEESAKEEVIQKMKNEPYYYGKQFDSFLSYDIEDVYEYEDED